MKWIESQVNAKNDQLIITQERDKMKSKLFILAVLLSVPRSFVHGQSDSTSLPPVYIVNYDHLGVMLWGEQNINWSLDVEFNRLRKYQDFTTGWDHEAYSYDYLERNDMVLLKKMQKGIKEFPGRLSIGTSTYGQPLSRFINEESNVRQLKVGIETVQKYFNLRPSVYLMSEHAFHSQTPQLLLGAGFKGAILRTHFMMFGYNPTINEPVVWWQGPDGSMIKTIPTYKNQEHEAVKARVLPFGAVTLDGRILTDFIRNKKATLQLFRQEFKDIRPLVASRADDPRQPDEIIEAHAGDPNFIWTVAERVIDIVPSPVKVFAPEATEFVVRMPWGFMGNWVWNKCREAETNVLTAERLAAINFSLGGSDRQWALEKSWKNLMVAQHHDVQIVGLEKAADAFLRTSIEQSEAVKLEALKSIGSKIGKTNEHRYVVFNPLNWERQEIIDGIPVRVPGLGFSAIKVSGTNKARALKAPPQVETPFYFVSISDDGHIDGIVEKASGVNYLRGGLRLQAQVNGKREKSMVRSKDLQVVRQDEKVILKQKGEVGSIPFFCSYTFYSHNRRIDLDIEINVKDEKIGNLTDIKKDPYSSFENEEKLLLKVFSSLDSSQLTGFHDEPFKITRTSNRLLQGNYWTAFSDGQHSIAVFNRGNMATEFLKDGSISIPLAFSTTFIWNTVPMTGTYTYQLALYPTTEKLNQEKIHKEALEYSYPVISIEVGPSAEQSLGEKWSPYEAKDSGAIVSALYTDSGKTYIRYYNPGQNQREIQIKWMNKEVSFTYTDFFGNNWGRTGTSYLLRPFGISTLKIDEKNSGRDYKNFPIPSATRFKYENDWTRSKWLVKGGMTQEQIDKCVIR